MHFRYRHQILVAFLVILLFGLTSAAFAQNKIDFNSQVRPILANNCYACHGPDDGQRVTDLRLDQQTSAFADLGGYVAVAPGLPDESELIERIFSDDPDSVMPPSDHLKQLTAQQKQILKDWIAQGAPWSGHWSFEKLKSRTPPETHSAAWSKNAIDHFVLAKLESEGLAPSLPAERRTLIRRLSSDLNGLPANRDLLAMAERDDWPQAYEEAVDRLLASDAFGERMATYWLDLVRYADSVGYHGDQPISVSPFRDYVINAFNHNMPFDRFTTEQLAGDLLESPSRDQLIASGYNRLGMMSAEGGVQPEEYLAKYASDRVRTTASVWLGITLGCAECHDHKFDPLSTREFYEFQAFFADIKERGLYDGAHQSKKWGPTLEVPDDNLAELLAPLDQRLAELTRKIVETPQVQEERRVWETGLKQADYQWQEVNPNTMIATNQVEITRASDQSILIAGANPNTNAYAITAELPPGTRALRLQALPHASLPKGGPGRAGNGNFVVTEFIILSGDQTSHMEIFKTPFAKWPDELKGTAVSTQAASTTFEQEYGGASHPDKKWSAASTIDRDARGKTWGWAILPETGQANELVLQIAPDQTLPASVTLVIQQFHGNGSHTLGHFQLSTSVDNDATASPLKRLPAEIRAIVTLDPSVRDAAQKQILADYFLTRAPSLKTYRDQISALNAQRQQLIDQHTRTSLITVSVPAREIRVLPRGDWMDRSGDVVSANVPAALGRPTWQSAPNRLDLAGWIVSPQNPLTARVFVNRIWKLLFGAGLAPVLDDFGAQGQAPSHPALLDWLAWDFQESGWDIKHLIKTIVISQAYQQSSSHRQDLTETDPENRWLARQARFRIDAEFIRDHALATSGLMVNKVGGRSVKPYQPSGLYQHLNFPKRSYQADRGDNQYRRGLYTHWQRQYLHPAMKIFDAPAREECTAARPRSSTPLAALVLLNDPSYVEAARALAERIMKQETADSPRFQALFVSALGRSITESEQDVLTSLLKNHEAYYSTHLEEAKKLLSVGNHPRDESLEPAKHAAWTSVCRAVINMHEFVTRY